MTWLVYSSNSYDVSVRTFQTVLLVLVSAVFAGCLPDRETVDSKNDSLGDTDSGIGDCQGRVDGAAVSLERLLKEGWNKEAAQAVVNINHRYLCLIYQEEPAQWDELMTILARLRDNKIAQTHLARCPELAVLLATTMEISSDAPTLIITTLPEDNEDRNRVESLYALFSDPKAACQLANLLRHDRQTVLRLARLGAAHLIGWLVDSYQNGTNQDDFGDYRHWVRTVITDACYRHGQGQKNALNRAYVLLTLHCDTLKKYLSHDNSFRQHFWSIYWPSYVRILDDCGARFAKLGIGVSATDDGEIANGEAEERREETEKTTQVEKVDDETLIELEWFSYVSNPRVWDYFHAFYKTEGNGVFSMFRDYGPIAVELALANEYARARQSVFEALKFNDDEIIATLLDPAFRDNQLFVRLLERRLPGSIVVTMIRQLRASPERAPNELGYWNSLSDDALMEVFGPPPSGFLTWIPGFYLFHLFHKNQRGIRIDGMDVLAAVGDAITVASVAMPRTKALTVRPPPQAARSNRFVSFDSRVWRATMVSRLPHPVPALPRRWSNVTADAFATQAAIHRRIRNDGVRFVMDAQSRLFVGFANPNHANTVVGRFLWETAQAAGVEAALKAAGVVAPPETAPDISIDEREAWRQHLSLWWISNHLERL
jgi:hypothetical protein